MRSSSMIKKIAIVLAILLAIVLLLYCTSFIWVRVFLLLGFGPKPLYEEYPNTVWVSSDPQIYMTVSDSPDGCAGSYLVFNGEKIDVDIYISQQENVAEIRLLSSNGTTVSPVLHGEHVRISDSEISWTVTWDKLFDGAYSTIILERQE